MSCLFNIKKLRRKFESKINHFFNKIFRLIPGFYFGFTGLLTFVISISAALILYITVDSTFSILTHWISDLGIGPNGSFLFFNFGLPIASIMIFIFHLSLICEMKKAIKNRILIDFALISAIIFSIGGIFAGIFPLRLNLLHGIAANLYFLGGLSFCSIYTIETTIIKKKLNLQFLLGLIAVISYMSFNLIQASTVIIVSLHLGMINYFLEWLTLFTQIPFELDLVINQSKQYINFRLKLSKFFVEEIQSV